MEEVGFFLRGTVGGRSDSLLVISFAVRFCGMEVEIFLRGIVGRGSVTSGRRTAADVFGNGVLGLAVAFCLGLLLVGILAEILGVFVVLSGLVAWLEFEGWEDCRGSLLPVLIGKPSEDWSESSVGWSVVGKQDCPEGSVVWVDWREGAVW